jgi:hypothetical protein
VEELWKKPSIIPDYDRTAFGKLMLFRGRVEGLDLLKESFLKKDYEAGKILSIYYKRRREFPAAAEIWREMWKNKKDIFQGIELAKYYEHKTKDIESALSIVQILINRDHIRNNSRIRSEMEHRLNRLERKQLIKK